MVDRKTNKLDLQELLKKTKSKAIFLLKENGETIDFYPKESNLNDIHEKLVVFKTTIFNMSNHFFSTFFNTVLTQIRLKSEGQNILMIRHNEYILCFLSDKKINTGLLELILKKEFNSEL